MKKVGLILVVILMTSALNAQQLKKEITSFQVHNWMGSDEWSEWKTPKEYSYVKISNNEIYFKIKHKRTLIEGDLKIISKQGNSYSCKRRGKEGTVAMTDELCIIQTKFIWELVIKCKLES